MTIDFAVQSASDAELRIAGFDVERRAEVGLLTRSIRLEGDASSEESGRGGHVIVFQGGLTVHGTHDVTVADNVCYDHVGHGCFLEDGIETNNAITGNLGMLSRVGSVIASDHTPATFRITHPDNTVEHDVSAGSALHGFWYAVEDHPTGPSATQGDSPRFTPLRRFSGNAGRLPAVARAIRRAAYTCAAGIVSRRTACEHDHGPSLRPRGGTRPDSFRG